MSRSKDIKYVVASALLLFASLSFIRTSFDVMKSNSRVEELKTEVLLLEQKKLALQTELEHQSSVDFIEKEAREKLNLIKPGEKIYVLDKDFEQKLDNSLNSRPSEVQGTSTQSSGSTNIESTHAQNLQMWLDIFY